MKLTHIKIADYCNVCKSEKYKLLNDKIKLI